MHHLFDARRQVIRRVASQHQVEGLRPDGLPAFRSDLESALGCRVAVHLANRIPREAWGRMLVETVPL